ncbi:MAG: dihydropteridine reductase [Lachnospiraceae bacterium]|nr:dihydropteridine reductase [Lachnospiraceae bacterium]
MNKNDQQFIAQKIRTQYMEKEEKSTDLDKLKALDSKVKRPANIFGYTFGTISALIMGSGMSLVMTDIGEKLGLGDMMVPGIVIGVVGMIMALVNYPIYKKLLGTRRQKYSKEIIELSEKIIENN